MGKAKTQLDKIMFDPSTSHFKAQAEWLTKKVREAVDKIFLNMFKEIDGQAQDTTNRAAKRQAYNDSR